MLRQNGGSKDWWGCHMDSLRGHFSGHDFDGYDREFDADDDDSGHDAPPSPVGQDERRMQVRAYNFWASLLDNSNCPQIDNLDPAALSDFGPYSVLLDFTSGIENPGVRFLGDRLAEECAEDLAIETLSDVPSRSLLSRITDHYMQIIANQAPIGFEAEFVNQRGATILYRGILLPFAGSEGTIEYIYGVINWKELADQQTADELLLQIDQALDPRGHAGREAGQLTEWADGPADTLADDSVLELNVVADAGHGAEWPQPDFGFAAVPEFSPDWDAACSEGLALADWLASARELAQVAIGSEDRSRQALYSAIGRAYDFSLAAASEPEEFKELVADCGLAIQDRAPMTPVVKLVFGADYDKTRITEYATALSHGHRLGLPRGALTGFLVSAPGGLKGVVNTERRLKREESGKGAATRETAQEALARALRQLAPISLADLPASGNEFTLLVARRLPDGQVVLLGEAVQDMIMLERAARPLIG